MRSTSREGRWKKPLKDEDALVVDLAELEEDRRRNEEDRKRMLDAYAEWLAKRGVIQPAAKRAPRQPRVRPRPTRRAK